jgi:hypothetical protein
MRYKLRTRPRLAAAVALSVAGGLLAAGSVPPAGADCIRYSAWTYSNKDGWEPIFEDKCVPYSDWGWNETMTPEAGHGRDIDLAPEGIPAGAGVEIGIPEP